MSWMTWTGAILIIVIGLIPGCVSNCASPWKGVSDYRSICYRGVAPTKMNWSSAMQYCASQAPNATLPYFNDISEYQSYRYLALSLNLSSTSCDYHWLSDAQNTEWLVNNLTYAFPYFDDTTPASCNTNESYIQHISTGYGWRTMCSSSENFFMCQLRYGTDPPVRPAKILTCSNGWMADVWGNCYLYVTTAAVYAMALLFCTSTNAILPTFCGIEDYREFVDQQRYFANYSCVKDTWLGGISGISSTCLFDTYAKFSNETQFGDDCSSSKAYFCQIRKYGCPLPSITTSTIMSSSSSTTYSNDISSKVLTTTRRSSLTYSLTSSSASLSFLSDATRFKITSKSGETLTVTDSTATFILALSTSTVSHWMNPFSNFTMITMLTNRTVSSVSLGTTLSFTTSSTTTVSSTVTSIMLDLDTTVSTPASAYVTTFSTAYTNPLALSSSIVLNLSVMMNSTTGPLPLTLRLTAVGLKKSSTTLTHSSTTAMQSTAMILTTLGITFQSFSVPNTSIVFSPKTVSIMAELPSPSLEATTSTSSPISTLSTAKYDLTTSVVSLLETARLLDNSSARLTTKNVLQTTSSSPSTMSRPVRNLTALTSSAIFDTTPVSLTTIIHLTTVVSTTIAPFTASILIMTSSNEASATKLPTTLDSATTSKLTHLQTFNTPKESLAVTDSSKVALKVSGSITTANFTTITNLQIQSSSIVSSSTFAMVPTTLTFLVVTTYTDTTLTTPTVATMSTINSSVTIKMFTTSTPQSLMLGLLTISTSPTSTIYNTASGTSSSISMLTTSFGPLTTRITTTVTQSNSTIATIPISPIYLTTVISTTTTQASSTPAMLPTILSFLASSTEMTSNSITYIFSSTAATQTESTATMLTTSPNYLSTTILEPATRIKSNTHSISVAPIIKNSLTEGVDSTKMSKNSEKLKSSTELSTLMNTSATLVTTSTTSSETAVQRSSTINIHPISPAYLITTISTTVSQANSTLAMLRTSLSSLTSTFFTVVKQTTSTETTPSFSSSIVPPTATHTASSPTVLAMSLTYLTTIVSENTIHTLSNSPTTEIPTIENSLTTYLDSKNIMNSTKLRTSNELASSTAAYAMKFESPTLLSSKITNVRTMTWSINQLNPITQGIVANSSSTSRSMISDGTIITGNVTTENHISDISFMNLGIFLEKSSMAATPTQSTLLDETSSSLKQKTRISPTESYRSETSMHTATLASLTSNRPSTVNSAIITSTAFISSRVVSSPIEDSSIFTTSMMDSTKVTNIIFTSNASKIDNSIQTTTISSHMMEQISTTQLSTTFTSTSKTSWTTTLSMLALKKSTSSVFISSGTSTAVQHVSSRASTSDETKETTIEWTTNSKKESTTKLTPETTVKLISVLGLVTSPLEEEQFTTVTMPSSTMGRDMATTIMLMQISTQSLQQTRLLERSSNLSLMKLETADVQETTSMPTTTILRNFAPQRKMAVLAVAVDYTTSMSTASRTIEDKPSNNVTSVISIQLQNSSSRHSSSRPPIVYPSSKLLQAVRNSSQSESILMIRANTSASSKTTLIAQRLETYHSATTPFNESIVVATTPPILSLIASTTPLSMTGLLMKTKTMNQSISDKLRIESSKEDKLTTSIRTGRSSSLNSPKLSSTQSYMTNLTRKILTTTVSIILNSIPSLSMKDAVFSSTPISGSVILTSFQQRGTLIGTTNSAARRTTSNFRELKTKNVNYITEAVPFLNMTLLPASLIMSALRSTESIMPIYAYSVKPMYADVSNYLSGSSTLNPTSKTSTRTSQTSILNNMIPQTRILNNTPAFLYPNSTALKTISSSIDLTSSQFHLPFTKSTRLSLTSNGSTALNIYLHSPESAALNFQSSQSGSVRLSVQQTARQTDTMTYNSELITRQRSNSQEVLLPTLIFSTTSKSILTDSPKFKSRFIAASMQLTTSILFTMNGQTTTKITITEPADPQSQIQTSERIELQQKLSLSTSPINMPIPQKPSNLPNIPQSMAGEEFLAAALVSAARSVSRIHTVPSITNPQHSEMTTGLAAATLFLEEDVQYASIAQKSVLDDPLSFSKLSTSEKLDAFGVNQDAVKDPMALTSSIQDSLSFIMQGLNDSMWSEIGEKRVSLISDCLFDRQSCNSDRQIKTIRNGVYGNCFSFNNDNEDVTKYSVSAGMENGFKLVLHINQSDYSCNVEKAGIRMLIHDQEVQPTPETDGYYVQTGVVTYFNIIQSKQKMMKPRCFDLTDTSFDYVYSVGNCQTMCYQDYMAKHCNCTDPRYRNVESRGYKQCSVEKKNCLDYYLTCSNGLDRLPCDCRPKCSDTSYTATITKTQMKTVADLDHRCRLNPNANCSKDLQYALVHVFYSSLSVIVFSEDHAYGFVQLLSDFSGVGGLYVGVGSFTIFECMPFVYWSFKHLVSLVITKINKD